MKIYSFQNKDIVDELEKKDEKGLIGVDFKKTHLYRNKSFMEDAFDTYFEAYKWMAEKLAEQTNCYLELPQGKIPPLPFWGWYKVDGKEEKPSKEYDMNGWSTMLLGKPSETYLLTLEIPEQLVLLSDINAFYKCLRYEPCFDYLSEEEEEKAKKDFEKKIKKLTKETDPKKAEKMAKDLDEYIRKSWEDIFIVDGSRRLRLIEDVPTFFPEYEKFDVQAAFPFIAKEWVKNIEKVRY